jgi:glucose/arabinose dehydrogenase
LPFQVQRNRAAGPGLPKQEDQFLTRDIRYTLADKNLHALRVLFMVAACALLLAARAAATTFPANFTETILANGLASPTAMEFAPDGRLFVAEQGGGLRVIKNNVLLPTPFVTLTVDASGERGLLGIAFDPAFASNHFVYVYYTATTPTIHNRVSRFTANGDVAVAGSEVALLDLETLGAPNHNGGAIHFGPDGKLYVAVGENAVSSNAQTLTNRLGKMLRINANGTIPADNPFPAAIGVNRAIWAIGLRNPYTFSFQPFSGRMFINDVGERAWEEINDGVAGANYGWPTTEGYTSDPRFKAPLLPYDHSAGCAITGGAFYNPSTNQYPAQYAGSYFFADYCGGWIANRDTAGTISGFAMNIVSPVDLKVGDDGSVYYLARGGGSTTGIVGRVAFGAAAPSITMHPADQSVSVGGSATFNVTASGTPPLSYQWQRNNVNIPGATGTSYTLSPVQATDDNAQFTVVVTNFFGSTESQIARLSVLNAAPTGTIVLPVVGTTYAGGSLILYSGTATDPEDGTLPATAFSWRVDFHHDTHIHPFIPDTAGAQSGFFVIPTTGETSANVWYRIHLTVTDSRGLTHESTRDVTPRTVQITIATNPSGLQVTLDGQPQTAPLNFTGVVGMTRNIGTGTPQLLNGTGWEFLNWSMGGAATQDVITPPSNTTFTATFRLACPPNVLAQLDLAGVSYTRLGTTAYYLQWIAVRNKSASVIQGPLVLVLGNVQQAIVAAPSLTTTCGPAASNPGVVFHAVDDRLNPGETTLVPVVYLKIGLLPITATPSVLSGLPLR